MMHRMFRSAAWAMAMGLAAMDLATAAAAQEAARGPIEGIEAIYGLAIDPANKDGLFLATQYGLLRAMPDGLGQRVPGVKVAVAGLAGSPVDRMRLLLSGYDESGAPAGILQSSDGGASWAAIPGTAGADGLVVSALSIGRGDPARLAGIGDGLIRLSDDGGASWRAMETTPDRTFSVARSEVSGDRLYAATMTGLMRSEDGGETWARSYDSGAPATLVATLSGNRIAGFVYGVGFVVADEADLDWQLVGDGFAGRFLTALTEDPGAPDRLFAVVDTGNILTSSNGGRDWTSFEGSDLATPERIAAGKLLFAKNCQTCHGVAGIGEDPADPTGRDEFGFKAPALNDDMHGWHHSDAGIRATIHKGSQRNERMIAWEEVLEDEEIDSILAYVKSLWSINSLACQGARHMRC